MVESCTPHMQQPLDPAEAYRLALAAHQAGQWQQAESAYLQLLERQPRHPIAATLLGTLYMQFGVATQAKLWFLKALEINPGQPDVLNNLGNLLRAENHYDEALDCYTRSIALNGNYLEARINRSVLLRDIGRLDEALADCRHALTIQPGSAGGHTIHAAILSNMGDQAAALKAVRHAIALNPNDPLAHNILGNVLCAQKSFTAALESYAEAIRLNPGYAEAYNNQATVLRELQRHEESLQSYDHALALAPEYADACYNKGIVLDTLARFDEALESYNRAISLNPNHGGAHWNKAQIKLLKGEWEEGWPLYEWRWHYKDLGLVNPFPPATHWDGLQPLQGKTLLLHTEQGLGDAILFARYIPLMIAQGVRVILKTSGALKKLMCSLPCPLQVVADNEPLPAYDFHYPLMSLPLVFGTRPSSIPVNIPYFSVPETTCRAWKDQLSKAPRPKIGIIWNGSTANPNDHNRSTTLQTIAPLLKQDYAFYCLQKEIRPEDQAMLHHFPQLQVYPLDDLIDTAALIQQMDLVISVCTSVAHLAGALGKPVWIMLTANADWRWLQNRTDSPWYPSAKLFRQQTTGHWDQVVEPVIQALNSTFPLQPT